jgi:hypothetical protein
MVKSWVANRLMISFGFSVPQGQVPIT